MRKKTTRGTCRAMGCTAPLPYTFGRPRKWCEAHRLEVERVTNAARMRRVRAAAKAKAAA